MKDSASRDEQQELLPINWSITLGDYLASSEKNKDSAETSFPEQIDCSK